MWHYQNIWLIYWPHNEPVHRTPRNRTVLIKIIVLDFLSGSRYSCLPSDNSKIIEISYWHHILGFRSYFLFDLNRPWERSFSCLFNLYERITFHWIPESPYVINVIILLREHSGKYLLSNILACVQSVLHHKELHMYTNWTNRSNIYTIT